MCMDADGTVPVEEEKCIDRWVEYFRELLNNFQALPAATCSAGAEEVQNAIGKIQNHEAPGSDTIPGELLKCGGTALWHSMYELIIGMWREEHMPDQSAGVIVELRC